MAKEAEEETIGDVLSRTAKLNKPEMTTEVESYGLEVDPDWTKEEIMEHFEEFLLEGAEEDPEPVVEEQVEEPAVLPPYDPAKAAPSPEVVSPEPSIVPQTYSETPPESPNVRIMRSPGWGRTGGAKAP